MLLHTYAHKYIPKYMNMICLVCIILLLCMLSWLTIWYWITIGVTILGEDSFYLSQLRSV